MRNIWEAVAEETSEALNDYGWSSSYGGKAFSRGDAGIHRQLPDEAETASYEGIEGTRSRVRTWSAAVPSGA
ncbi:hypothetical protein [Paenibacillus larvae]|uniref:hypothetical protein n=1 Tax=Paenibacillus larvae TaxID=1464 RepID=UPI0037C66DC0